MKERRNWLKIGAGVGIFAIGITIALLGNGIRNSMLIVIGGLIVVAGGWLAYSSWNQKVYSGKDKSAKQPNTFSIMRDSVVFEYVDDPPGHAHKYRNTGEDFYWRIYKDDSWQEFKLPDAELGITPAECANPAEMEAVKEYFSYMPTTPMKMVTAGILGLIIIGEVIGMVAMTGS